MDSEEIKAEMGSEDTIKIAVAVMQVEQNGRLKHKESRVAVVAEVVGIVVDVVETVEVEDDELSP